MISAVEKGNDMNMSFKTLLLQSHMHQSFVIWRLCLNPCYKCGRKREPIKHSSYHGNSIQMDGHCVISREIAVSSMYL